MRIWLGTSGFQYRDWRGRFSPQDLAQARWLEFYASRFRTCELNVTFYRLPTEPTFAGWRERTPADFVMVVKASRYLSHVKRLLEPGPSVDLLMSRARLLGRKLGPILLQLPPTMRADPARLDAALAAFDRHDARVAFEPRHESWWSDETDDGDDQPYPKYSDAVLGRWLERLLALGVDDAWVFFQQRPRLLGRRRRLEVRRPVRRPWRRGQPVPRGDAVGTRGGMTVVDPVNPPPDLDKPEPMPGGPDEPVTPLTPDPQPEPSPSPID